ncbi:MAG: PAS domain-containing protein [Pseudomonadota bacterium]|nr:PAS domain-containing protein [Pseudomonadota bacterium]
MTRESLFSQSRLALLGVATFGLLIAASIGAQRNFGNGFLPHGYCFTWIPALLWLHVVSDTLIALAYLSIPITLVYFVKRRRDLPFGWVFVLFGIFIVACGMTHAMDVWTIWNADYWLAGGVKAITAAASVPTALALVWLMPKALAIPSTQQLRDANDALLREIETRKAVEARLEQSRAQLNDLVSERTLALKQTAALLDAFFDSSPLGLAVFDSRLRYVRVNPTLAAISGLPVEYHWGRTIEEVNATADPRLREILKEVRDGTARVLQHEVTGKSADNSGRRRWRVTFYKIKAAGDPLIGCACEDITSGGSLPAMG